MNEQFQPVAGAYQYADVVRDGMVVDYIGAVRIVREMEKSLERNCFMPVSYTHLRKGMHVQFNVVDRNTLIDAQNNPDKHKDLVIRVAGYSAHFTKLAKETQDNIIARTEMEF